MDITYERKELDHCEVSKRVRDVTVRYVKPAENSDRLEKIYLMEVGWQCISQKGLYEIGDEAMLIPPDSVLPFELGEELNITNYLSKGRLRVTRFRGNRSEGLLVDKERLEKYLPYILKWEDKPTINMSGEMESYNRIPHEFYKYIKMENFLNVPYMFDVGEEIYYSEKYHGTNTRMAAMPNPETNLYKHYVGSHNVVLRETKNNLYWKAFNKYIRDKIPTDMLFFGEIFGPGIQHLTYGRKEFDILLFGAMKNGEYLSVPKFIEVCDYNGLPRVNFHKTIFDTEEQLRNLADLPSEATDKHIREGIVVISAERPESIAKVISFDYLTSKKIKKKRTERH